MRNEADFTNYIQNRLAAVEIFSDTQSSHNVELDGALKTASKNQRGNAGYPDHIALVEDFVLVMEDKSDRLKLVLRGDDNEISQSVDATQNYAVNGALFYAQKIIDGTRYKKIFAFGNAGDSKHHIFQPIFIDEQKNITELPPVDTFKNFTTENIDAYYRRMVLKEESAEEVELRQILRHAETLHEHLRNYGQLGEDEKPLVVSAILLALAEEKNFDISQLTGDKIKTDGEKIFEHVENHLKRANVRPTVKKEQVLSQFRLIKDRPILNTVNRALEKTPLKYFTEFIADKIYDAVVNNSAEDYLGRFYGEFISYSGGDGQSLGVVLTPRHIAELRNGEGSVGYSVYKREDFIATSDITCGYADFLNEYVGMFITTVADKVRGKYNFNYKRSDTRLRGERLMLPVNESGAPDFEYMAAFMKNILAQKYQRYLEYLGA